MGHIRPLSQLLFFASAHLRHLRLCDFFRKSPLLLNYLQSLKWGSVLNYVTLQVTFFEIARWNLRALMEGIYETHKKAVHAGRSVEGNVPGTAGRNDH